MSLGTWDTTTGTLPGTEDQNMPIAATAAAQQHEATEPERRQTTRAETGSADDGRRGRGAPGRRKFGCTSKDPALAKNLPPRDPVAVVSDLLGRRDGAEAQAGVVGAGGW